MNSDFSKPFHNIQKHVPKNQTSEFWIDCEDNNSKMFITQDKSSEYVLYQLKSNKIIKIKQSQDCEKLQQLAEKEMKKGWSIISQHVDYRREQMRKELDKYEIDQMCAKYPYECKYLGSHQGSSKEIADMLRESKHRMCSYT